MKDLNWISNFLKDDPQHIIDIMNCEDASYLKRKLSWQRLANEYGDLQSLFSDLKAEGYKTVQVFPRIKQGTGFKNKASVITVSLESTERPNHQIERPAPPPMVSAPKNLETFGLGMPQILNGVAAERENQMLKTQLAEQTNLANTRLSEINSLKTEITALQRACDRHDIQQSLQKDPDPISVLIGKLAENPQTIPSIISALKKAPVAPGLSGDQTPADPYGSLSEIKQVTIRSIAQPAFGDSVIEMLYQILFQFQSENDDFIDQLGSLIENHNLKVVRNG